jgi:hypothetical protein
MTITVNSLHHVRQQILMATRKNGIYFGILRRVLSENLTVFNAALTMEAGNTSETPVIRNETIWHYISGDSI